MTPEQMFKFAVGRAVQEAKKMACVTCGKVGLHPGGAPLEKRERDRFDPKNFILLIRVPFVCECGTKHNYTQRSWHDRNTGQKVVPEYALDPTRN